MKTYNLQGTLMMMTNQFMRILLLIVILSSLELRADFPQLLKIKANSSKAELSEVMESGKKYRITVTGEFSIWSEQLGNGIDAAYVYDVPKSIIDNNKWPVEEYIDTISGNKFNGYKLPIWVGDSRDFPDDTNLLSVFPDYKLNLRKWTGFRVNNEPLPKGNYDSAGHIYQFERQGDGNSLSFSIIDSVFKTADGSASSDYENNSGELQVLIEVVEDFNVNICSAEPILDANGNMKAIKIDVSVLVIDSNKITGKRNILFDENQVAILDKGAFVCPDSIRCNKNVESVSIAMLFDRSASMNDYVSRSMTNGNLNDTTTKIDIGIKSLSSFVKRLSSNDQGLLISFSEPSDIDIDVDWTTNKTALLNSVNTFKSNLNFTPGTALHSALNTAISRTKIHYDNRIKAIVALTDGANNREPFDEQQVINTLPAARNIPIYLIALGMDTVRNNSLTNLDSIRIDSITVYNNINGLAKMQKIADASNGKLFYITNSNALEEAYSMISRDIREEECCSIYYPVQDCQKGSADSIRTIVVYYPFKGGVTAKTTTYKTSCAKTFLSKRQLGGDIHTKYISTKGKSTSSVSSFSLTLPKASSIRVEILDANGKSVRKMTMKNLKKGINTITISPNGMEIGSYTAKVFLKGTLISQHELLIQE